MRFIVWFTKVHSIVEFWLMLLDGCVTSHTQTLMGVWEERLQRGCSINAGIMTPIIFFLVVPVVIIFLLFTSYHLEQYRLEGVLVFYDRRLADISHNLSSHSSLAKGNRTTHCSLAKDNHTTHSAPREYSPICDCWYNMSGSIFQDAGELTTTTGEWHPVIQETW